MDDHASPLEEKVLLKYEEHLASYSPDAKTYHDIRLRLSNLRMVTEPIILLVLLFIGFPNVLSSINPFGQDFSFLGVFFMVVILIVITTIIGIPFSLYSEKIEREYGFSTRSNKKYWADFLKGFLLQLLLFPTILALAYIAIHFTGTFWWIWASLGAIIFVGLLQMLSPILLVPLFTKLEPLPKGDLRDKMVNLAETTNTPYKDIYLWKMSQQTNKPNAAVMGFGNTIRICIGDTLIRDFREDEIEIVMCHEIGHQKNRDVYRIFGVISIIFTFAFFVTELIFNQAVSYFEYSSRSDPASVLFFYLAISLLLQITSVAQLAFSRSREKAADIFAIKQIPNYEVYESAFTRMSKVTLTYPNPSFLEVLFKFSHPPIRDRIQYVKPFLD